MAGVLRVGVLRFVNSPIKPILPILQQKCNISGRTMKGNQKVVKPPPYPYKTKKYYFHNALFDKTTKRFDENSKIIVVEGPIASGKSQFAKELAEELEMLHVPEATMDLMYINSYGYNMRQLNPELPDSCKTFDEKNFCETPNARLVANFQIQKYMLKYSQYIDALAHVLSTGQGVVLERCCYSDYVFLEAMFKNNFISKGARSVYYELRQNTIRELMKPHLVIYLDVPLDKTKENIKKRGNEYEIKSAALTNQYLSDMDSIYKQEYLRDISTHAELLVYDWSNGGETEVVVEDIERINFDGFDKHDPKLKDWRIEHEWDWCNQRMKYTNCKDMLLCYFNVPRFDVPELLRDADDAKQFRDVWYNAPGMKYEQGYNADMGDTGLFTKTKLPIHNN